MKCPRCGTDNEAGFRFCVKCGVNLEDPQDINIEQVDMGGYQFGYSRITKMVPNLYIFAEKYGIMYFRRVCLYGLIYFMVPIFVEKER